MSAFVLTYPGTLINDFSTFGEVGGTVVSDILVPRVCGGSKSLHYSNLAGFKGTGIMDLNPQLPPLSTLTPIVTLQNVPPDRPPDPSISVLFPEATPFCVPGNPFRGPLSKVLEKTHRRSLSEALNGIRGSLLFTPDK